MRNKTAKLLRLFADKQYGGHPDHRKNYREMKKKWNRMSIGAKIATRIFIINVLEDDSPKDAS